jgi:serine/threonine-protein kinase
MPVLCPWPRQKPLRGDSNAPLPADLANGAVVRLGKVAILLAALFVVMHLVFTPATRAMAGLRPFYIGVTIAAVVLGVGMFVISRSSWFASATKLDLGLVFEVAAAFLIALPDTRLPIPPEMPVPGQSTISAWVTLFALVVPAPLGKAAFAAFAAAAMGPAATFFNFAVNGVPIPTVQQMLMMHLLPFLLAAASVALSRFVYDLGRELSSEREMGSYQLVERIGQGGMGEVWRARHRVLVRDAAVKLIRAEALGSSGPSAGEALERRFELEAKATAALQSPHTVAIYDYGRSSDGSFYYVMEMLDGVDLEDFVKRFGPMPAARVVHVLRHVCDSLAEAHLAGLTHRDIKPRNIFLCRLGLNFDHAKVLDFGLVKSKHVRETQLTGAGLAAGTPAYMAPEMALGKPVDGRADLYALGCVAYWLLTGCLVFSANTAVAMAMEHVQAEPAPMRDRTEMEIPDELESVVRRCLAKDPRRRPQTARELSRLLAALPLGAWNDEHAEEWWRTHMPARTQPALQAYAAAGIAGYAR